MNKFNAYILIAVVFFGLSARFFTFQSSHPDSDEMFELRNMQDLKPEAVLKQNTFYGDHTSYPGEYLIHYLPMKALGLLDHPAKIDIEHQNVSGIDKKGFWVLAIPKIMLTLLSVWIFFLLCREQLKTTLGMTIAFSLFMFNSHMIYHAFSLRPYGILPELAIFNLYMASRKNEDLTYSILYGILGLFTLVYHAYGILIVGLSFWFFNPKPKTEFFMFWAIGCFCWIYYAAYSNMGMSPNKVQSVVDTFQFIPKENFLGKIADSIFGGNVFTLAIVPFILIGLQYLNKRRLMFLLILIVLPMALIMAIDIKSQYWIHPRQYIWLIPAIALWCGMITEASFGGGDETQAKQS